MINTKKSTAYIAKIGVLSAMASIIMFFEFMLPFMPTFLKIDFSEIPALLAAFALGPIGGVAVELIKNLIHLTVSTSSYVGELSNFLVGCAYVVPAGLIYKCHKNKKGAVIALAAASLSMTFIAALLNYFIFIPLYAIVYNIPVSAMIGGNKLISDLKTLILFGIVPFNVVKAIIISVITIIVYKKLSPILHYQRK